MKMWGAALLFTAAGTSTTTPAQGIAAETGNFRQAWIPQPAGPEIAPNVVLLKPRQRLGFDSLRAAFATNKATQRFNFREPVDLGVSGAILMKFGPVGTVAEAITALEATGLVEYAEPDSRVYPLRTPNDPQFLHQWAFEKIQAPLAWDAITGTPLLVAVVDSGGDLDHPDLATNWWTNPDERVANGVDDDRNGIVDDIHGARFFNQGATSGNPQDQDGHGTHVSGTIGAVTNNQLGVAGTNWSVRVMAVRFIDVGSGWTSDAARALSYALTKGAKVINNSWGSRTSNITIANTIKALSDRGVLVVNAAGNDGTNNDTTPMYPANYKFTNTLAVAATTSTDTLAYFSNTGPNTVELGAPGLGILSTVSNDAYTFMSGTSMASPHVAGSLALLGGAFPQASAPTLKQLLLASIDDRNLSVNTRGRLNLSRAIAGPFSFASPTAGSMLLGGSTTRVAWSRLHLPACTGVTGELSSDGGSTFPHRLFSGSTNDGVESAGIPEISAENAVIRLACDGLHVSSISAKFQVVAPLTIVFPNGGERLKGAKQVEVRWKQQGGQGACPSIDISLSRDGGTSYFVLAGGVPNSASATVKLPNTTTKAGLMMVKCTGTEFGDSSDAAFTIKRPLPLLELGVIGLFGLVLLL